METEASTVLIVDDDRGVRTSLKRLLRASGKQVHTYSSVAHLSHSGRPPEPCCLILDVHLPGEDGLHFKETLDRAGVRIPIIFISGVGDVSMGVRAMKAGAVDFLTKPFEADELLRLVDAALDADARMLEVERRMAALRRRFETLTARDRGPGYAVSVLAASPDLSIIDVDLRFVAGRTYCCAEPGCHLPRDAGQQRLRRLATERAIPLPESVTVHWHCHVERGAKLERMTKLGLPVESEAYEFEATYGGRGTEPSRVPKR